MRCTVAPSAICATSTTGRTAEVAAAERSEMLRPPGAETLVLNEVVVHGRLAVVAEVQHARTVVQEATWVLKQRFEGEESRAVRRKLHLRIERVTLIIFERHVRYVRARVEVRHR